MPAETYFAGFNLQNSGVLGRLRNQPSRIVIADQQQCVPNCAKREKVHLVIDFVIDHICSVVVFVCDCLDVSV